MSNKAEIVFYKYAKKNSNNPYKSLITGGLGGIVSSAVVQPLDTISRRQQIKGESFKAAKGAIFAKSLEHLPNSSSKLKKGVAILKRLYSGYPSRIPKIGIGMGITFGVGNYLNSLWN